MVHLTVQQIVDIFERGACFVVPKGADELQSRVDAALKEWAQRPAPRHEVIFAEYNSVYQETEYQAQRIPHTKSGYQDASPGPHAREVAERGNKGTR